MLSPLCVLRTLSAIVGLTSIVTSLGQLAACCLCGIVFVTCEARREKADRGAWERVERLGLGWSREYVPLIALMEVH